MTKKEIRQAVLAKLTTLHLEPELKKQQEATLYQQLFNSQRWQDARVIGVTHSTAIEVNTAPIIAQAWREGKIVAVPKVLPQREMAFIAINDGTKYEESSFGIQEPVNNDTIDKNKCDLLIVPGVAFRLDGYRIGFGGGYYDRYLADYPGETCSLVFPEQLGFDWQAMAYDVPVKTIITL